MISFIPNFITSLRLLLAIPISISIYQGNEVLALILFVIAGVSDSLDGFLARKFNWESIYRIITIRIVWEILDYLIIYQEPDYVWDVPR